MCVCIYMYVQSFIINHSPTYNLVVWWLRMKTTKKKGVETWLQKTKPVLIWVQWLWMLRPSLLLITWYRKHLQYITTFSNWYDSPWQKFGIRAVRTDLQAMSSHTHTHTYITMTLYLRSHHGIKIILQWPFRPKPWEQCQLPLMTKYNLPVQGGWGGGLQLQYCIQWTFDNSVIF